MREKKPIRMILTEDGGTLMGWRVLPTKKIIEDLVAGYGGQGVDVLSYGLQGGHLCPYDSKVLNRQHIDPPHDDSVAGKNVRHMAKIGLDFPAIIADASHRHGMQFWPTVRMNSTGGVHSLTHEKHPDWFFAGYANIYGFCGGYRPLLDYESAGVRKYMLGGFRELVADYDADGLQLDFTRYPALFHPDRAYENTQLLTDYVGQVRGMLDEVGRTKGKRLSLAVQVLAHPDHGIAYGHDIRAWIRKSFVDWVLPSQSNNNDCNLPVDLWMKIVQGTDCRVFPTIHPYCGSPWTKENRSTLQSLRGTAHLYYGQGAHGLSTVNMFEAVQNQWFKELRDPAKVARGPHHYRYTFNAAGRTLLDLRTDSVIWRVTTPIRIVDDPTQFGEGKLTLTIENLTDEAELMLLLNGETIPRIEDSGRRHYLVRQTARENVSQIEIPLSQLKLVRGKNLIGMTLDSTRPRGEAWVMVTEVELLVQRLTP